MNYIDKLERFLEANHGYGPQFREDIARSMLKMIREPTSEIIAAGAKKVRGGSPSDCAAATWRAMVDEMLK